MNASTTVLAFLSSIAVKATVLVLLAAAVDRGIMRRRASASARHLLWSITLGSALLLPLAGWLVPSLDVPLPAALGRGAVTTSPTLRLDAAVAEQVGGSRVPAGVTPSGRALDDAPRARPFSAADILLAVYLAGVVLLFGRVAAEQRIVRRLERSATPLRDVEWHALFHSVVDELGIRRRVAMLHGAANTMPLTWGVKHPAVLIPATAADWPESRRRAVLLHELAHVTRLDCLTQTLAAITCALYWPHPGIWWAAHRLRIERELACDDQALLAGIGAHDYAGHLLEIAHLHRVPDGLRTLAVSMAARSHLETRLLAAIDGARRRSAPGRAPRAACVALAVLLLIPLAALRGDAAAAPRSTARDSAQRSDESRPTAPIAVSLPDSMPAPAPAPVPADADTIVFTGPATPRSSSTPLDGRWIVAPWKATMVKLDLEWSDDTQWRRALPIADLHGVTAEQFAAPKVSTVTFSIDQDAGRFEFEGIVGGGRGAGQFRFVPNREFVDVLRSLGIRELGTVSDHQLKNLAFGGMSATALRGFGALGLGELTKEDIIELAIRMVTPDYVRDMRAAGVSDSVGAKGWAELSFNGVTTQYVREMAALGYEKLSTRDLTALWHAGVTPAFIKDVRGPGERLTKEELIQRVEEVKAKGRKARAGRTGGPVPPASRAQ